MPPSFLYIEEGSSIESADQRRVKVMQAVWNEYRDLLGDTSYQQRTGYVTLKTLEASLEERLKPVRKQTETKRAYRNYYRVVIIKLYNEGLEHGMDKPLGAAYPGMIEVGSETWRAGWDKHAPVINALDRTDVDNIDWEELYERGTISFGLRDENMIRKIRDESGYKLDSLAQERFEFSPTDTFGKAFESIKKHAQLIESLYKGAEETLRLLQFRQGVLRNVLWQFELFGRVGALTSEEAGQILDEAGSEETQSGRPPKIDYESLERILPELINCPKFKHQKGPHEGQWYVAEILREIERKHNTFDGVSERQARHAISVTLEKLEPFDQR